jgi:MarR family transcriptional regulator, organic hydroperoxide resistance regulator
MAPGPAIPDRPGAVIAALQQATHATLRGLAASLADLGFAGSEQNVLAALADGQVRSVGELAEATGTKPSTLTSVLDRLEHKRQLERDVDYADRRLVLISLTPPGRESARAVLAAMTTLEESALAGISRPQLAGFFAVTRALSGAVR